VHSKSLLIKWIKIVSVIFYFCFLIFPIIWIFMMSIKTRVEITSDIPVFFFTPTFENYQIVTGLKKVPYGLPISFFHYFFNSLCIALSSVFVTLVVGVPVAYVCAKIKFPGRNTIAFTFLTFRFAPELAVILPLYAIYQKVNLYDTLLGLVLSYQLITLPICIWLMISFFMEIPREIEEAALVDGCSQWQVLRKISFPLAMPGLAVTMLIAFIYSWNNLVIPLLLAGRNMAPITVGLLNYISFEQVFWGQMAAATSLAIIPGILISIFIQKKIVQGLTFGAVKG